MYNTSMRGTIYTDKTKKVVSDTTGTVKENDNCFNNIRIGYNFDRCWNRENLSAIFVGNKSRWGAVGLGVLSIILGSIAVVAPVSTAVFVIFMLGSGLL